MRLEKIKLLAKGFHGRNKNVNRVVRLKVDQKLQHQYRLRKEKKREARSLWIMQVNAGAREHGLLKYSEFIHGLKESNISLNRKVLADIARDEPYSFKSVVDVVKFFTNQKSA